MFLPVLVVLFHRLLYTCSAHLPVFLFFLYVCNVPLCRCFLKLIKFSSKSNKGHRTRNNISSITRFSFGKYKLLMENEYIYLYQGTYCTRKKRRKICGFFVFLDTSQVKFFHFLLCILHPNFWNFLSHSLYFGQCI